MHARHERVYGLAGVVNFGHALTQVCLRRAASGPGASLGLADLINGLWALS